jgi:hypothetical protein
MSSSKKCTGLKWKKITPICSVVAPSERQENKICDEFKMKVNKEKIHRTLCNVKQHRPCCL